MKVILIKDVPKLGKRFDVKDVSSGHALNLLIPQGHVISATPDAVKKMEAMKKKIEGEKKVQIDLIAKNIKDLDGMTLNVTGKANEKGHLFAGLHKEEIVKEIMSQTRLEVDPSFVELEHPIKTTGEHLIEVKGAGKSAKFKLVVSAK